MTCQLWQRGLGESGSGPLNYDRVCVANWNPVNPIPTLTATSTGNIGYGVFTRYTDSANTGCSTGGWYTKPEYYLKGCGSVDVNQPYDCINGGCLPKTTYNTPGFYANLAACQSGCAKNSNCKGVCVPSEELAALQQAANQLQSKVCK